MVEQLYYDLDEPYNCKDKRKKYYIGVRLDQELYNKLLKKIEREKIDISEIIRTLLEKGV